MIAVILAVALTPPPTGVSAAPLDDQAPLSIDPCVGADPQVVGALLDIELGWPRAAGPTEPQSIAVRCVEGGEEIRVEPWASLGPDGVRTIHLPAAEPSDPAAAEGRARELALAIAELIRRLEATQPLSPPAPPPAPVAIAPPVVAAPPPPPARPPERWRAGLLSTVDAFGGGQRLLGADLVVAAAIGRWFTVELRGGGRVAPDDDLPLGHLTARALAGSTAAGFVLRRPAIDVGLALRAQGFLVQFGAEPQPAGASQTAVLAAVTLQAEPRVCIRVSRHVWIQASAGAGAPLHGIEVRLQGVETRSLSGLVVSASLGAGLAF